MRVYAVTGVPPEVQAYAMAKYSRSAQSMRESIGELSAQRAEQFLDTFYFQYGHRSIADLAHIALAIEDISILAAIRLVDEPLWDGQERSTRYQDFSRRKGEGAVDPYVTPDAVAVSSHADHYRRTAERLFGAYHALSRRLAEILAERYPRPAEMEHSQYRRTLRARAFDVARYLLPMATRTSVGQITSARVLEGQIARLLADPLPEARAIGAALRSACQEPAYDLTRGRIEDALRATDGGPAAEAVRAALGPPGAVAPTLVKYAEPAPYPPATHAALTEAATAYLGRLPVERAVPVELAEPESPEDEAVATLLYRADAAGHSYRQIQAVVRDLSPAQRDELLDLSFRGRGPHDPWLREHRVGYAFIFDVLLDAGAFRDLHRHRRCVQIVQPFGVEHGFDDPREVLRLGLAAAADDAIAAGAADEMSAALREAMASVESLSAERPHEAAYLLPLGARVRALFKMDAAQAAYITELRTGVTGHFSYRRIAFLMYQALAERHPALARYVRITDPEARVDMLRR
jgi:thymidylate synthase ThyX